MPDIKLPKGFKLDEEVKLPKGFTLDEKKNKTLQSVAPTISKPLSVGSKPFQDQVDTSVPSVLLTDEQKKQSDKEGIGKRFETTLLDVPTEFGKVGRVMRAAKQIQETLPQAPEFTKVGEIPRMQPTQMTEGQRLGESLTKGEDFQDVITDKLTDKKTGLQKQLESAQDAYRTYQGDEMADQARAQSGEEPIPFVGGYENIAPLLSGIQGTVSSIYKLPRLVYDVFAMPQNLAADLADIPGLQANYNNVSKGTFNPLAYLEYAGDYTKGQEAKWQSRQRKYDEGVFDQLSNFDFGGAALQVYDNVIASAPSIAAMYLSGGVANAAKLNSLTSKLVTSLPFASAQNQALVENENVPEWLKPVNAAFNGLSEIMLEGRFGTTAILNGITKVATTEGAEAAAKYTKEFVYNYIKKVLAKVQPVTDVVSNAAEEMATMVSQNIVAIATGEDPNRKIMDGVADAGIIGGAQGAGASVLRKGLDVIVNKKSKDKIEKLTKQRDDLVSDLDNENVPETVKEQIENKLESVTEDLNNTLDENRNEINNLPEEDKVIVVELANKIEVIKESLENESISETSKNLLQEELKAAEKELDDKFKAPQLKIETREDIIKEIRAAEAEMERTGDFADYKIKIDDLNARLENLVPEPEVEGEIIAEKDVESKKAKIDSLQEEIDLLVPEQNRLSEIVNNEDRRVGQPESENEIKLKEIINKSLSLVDERNAIEKELAALEQAPQPTQETTVDALKDVESTTKALEGKNTGLIEASMLPAIAGGSILGKNANQTISEAYHKAKADGSNPELVEAVENLLKPQTDAIQEQTAGQVPVLTEATAGQEVEQGKPEAKPKVVTEEGAKTEEVGGVQKNVEEIKNKDWFHGSENEFDTFENKNPNITGFWFSDSKDNAATYGDKVKSVKLDIKKPLIIDAGGKKFTDDIEVEVLAKYPNEKPYLTKVGLDIDEIVWMVKNGKRKNSFIEIPNNTQYDAVVFKNIIDPSLSSRSEIPQTSIAVLDKNKIKPQPKVEGVTEEGAKAEEVVSIGKDVEVGAKPKPIDEQGILASEKWIKDLYSLPELTRIQDKNGNVYDIKNAKIRKLTLDKEGNVVDAEVIHIDRNIYKKGTYSNPEFFNEGYKVLSEQSPTIQEQTPAQQVEQLRAEEQAELNEAIPNAKQYLTDGKIDRSKITNVKDLRKFDEIYDKYDKLITPLLPEKAAKVEEVATAKPKDEPKLKAKISTTKKFKEAINLFYDISAADGNAKKGSLARKRQASLAKNPSIKYIDDNWKNISKQLEDKGLITKEGNCP